MTSLLTLLNVTIIVICVGYTLAIEIEGNEFVEIPLVAALRTKRRLPRTRSLYRAARSTDHTHGRSSTRKETSTRAGKKPSLFSRIVSRMQHVRSKQQSAMDKRKSPRQRYTTRRVHPVHRWSTKRKTVEKVPARPRYTTRVRRPVVERPPARRGRPRQVKKPVPAKSSAKKSSLFSRIMSRINHVTSQHKSNKKVADTRRKYTTRVRRPTVERPPVKRIHRVRRPTIERPPVRRVRPVEKPPVRRVQQWSSRRRKPAPKPAPVVPAASKKTKASLFARIMQRVTQIRNNHGNHYKPRITSRVAKKPVRKVSVVKRRPPVRKWKPPTCLRKSCMLTRGMGAAAITGHLVKLYVGDASKVLKVVTWNVFEGNTSSTRYIQHGRQEVCSKLKAMNPTIFGLQAASLAQISYVQRCLPRSQYSHYKGYGRYVLGLRKKWKYVYNPIFYKITGRQALGRISSGYISAKGPKRRTIRIASYVKVKTAKSGKQFLLINANLAATKPTEATQQMQALLKRLPSLSSNWRIPVILMGDFVYEEDSPMYKAIYDQGRLRNTLDKSKTKDVHPAYSRFTGQYNRYKSKDVVDYLLEAGLRTVFAAVVNDNLRVNYYRPSHHRPVIAAFVMP